MTENNWRQWIGEKVKDLSLMQKGTLVILDENLCKTNILDGTVALEDLKRFLGYSEVDKFSEHYKINNQGEISYIH